MRLKGYFLSIALMGLGSAAIAQQEPEHWLEFNGEDQYVVIPSHSDFDLGTDDDLTITCWVSMDQLKNGQRFVARRYMNTVLRCQHPQGRRQQCLQRLVQHRLWRDIHMDAPRHGHQPH